MPVIHSASSILHSFNRQDIQTHIKDSDLKKKKIYIRKNWVFLNLGHGKKIWKLLGNFILCRFFGLFGRSISIETRHEKI